MIRVPIPRAFPFLPLFFSSLFVCQVPVRAEDPDFGKVAQSVANMLESHHLLRRPFDDEVSTELLDNYLDFLDFNHVYFTKEDVNLFRSKYATTLDDEIFSSSIEPANEIYELYHKRVRERVAKIKETLKNEAFTFDSSRTTYLSREDVDWPADEQAADQTWRNMLEGELLQEVLREENQKKKEQAKEEEPSGDSAPVTEEPATDSPLEEPSNSSTPDSGESPPTDKEATSDDNPLEEPTSDAGAEKEKKETPSEKIIKRYERFLDSLNQNSAEDVANYFLSSLAATYDPHSEYFSYSEWKQFLLGMRHSLVGIGALLSMKEGTAEIQGIVVGGPADRSGQLQINDKIIAVGQGTSGEMVDITYMKLQKVVEMIRGKKDTLVRLKIIPADSDGSESKEILINRDEVKLKDKLATAELIKTRDPAGNDVRLGWIYLPSFYADMEHGKTSTTVDVNRLLQRLNAEGIKGLVLDLRRNGGGSLEEAIKLTGLFISRGPVVQQKDFKGMVDWRNSRKPFPTYDDPMIVLTDRVSASASEILAAALQDYNRALIVGQESTFGKG
ncbi:MAG: S41 family peptidase, partial [Verrucomicrobiota bacterium]